MYEVLAVALGGAAGAVARLAVANTAYTIWGRDFPWGILIVNAVGSLLLGFLGVLLLVRFNVSDAWRAGITIGVLGAFTTFSTFSLDTLLMIEQGHLVKAASNIVANVALCLLFVWGGMALARQF